MTICQPNGKTLVIKLLKKKKKTQTDLRDYSNKSDKLISPFEVFKIWTYEITTLLRRNNKRNHLTENLSVGII